MSANACAVTNDLDRWLAGIGDDEAKHAAVVRFAGEVSLDDHAEIADLMAGNGALRDAVVRLALSDVPDRSAAMADALINHAYNGVAKWMEDCA